MPWLFFALFLVETMQKMTYNGFGVIVLENEITIRGFLKEDFRLFHLKDTEVDDIEFHYHDFDKIVIYLSGSTRYIVEGRTYFLKPWDILFIRHGQIHRPKIDGGIIYERIVIWINPEYLERNSTSDFNLSRCFFEGDSNLFRPSNEQKLKIIKKENEIEDEMRIKSAGSDIAVATAFLQFMVEINRQVISRRTDYVGFKSDSKIEQIIKYINTDLSGDLSIDTIANKFFISKYYFMRKFKSVTGYTVHNYITQKRLINAAELITSGQPATLAAAESGFADYSVFLRSFKKTFQMSPREFANQNMNNLKTVTVIE